MSKTITVLTATRAEYGLLKPIIIALRNNVSFCVKIVATGAHLSPEFGLTYKEIENDGFQIDRKVEILMSSDSPTSISKSMGLAMISFAEYFEQTKTDGLLVLGDRYETLAVCCAAMNAQIPIMHLYGGETTEGAVDEAIRHAITKMSYLHFTSTELYRHRIIQLGEHPSRVFNVGAIGVENALKVPLLSREELEDSLNFKLGGNYALLTFHPVTLEQNADQQFTEILKAISQFRELKILFTKANADANGRIINRMIDKYCQDNPNCVAVDSLGMLRYLSAIRYCRFVIGNSSSGLIEVPSFKVPTINIGDRQKGRLQAESIINCPPVEESIIKAIELAQNKEFRDSIQDVKNPYGNGCTTNKIIKVLEEEFLSKSVNLKKEFYDL